MNVFCFVYYIGYGSVSQNRTSIFTQGELYNLENILVEALAKSDNVFILSLFDCSRFQKEDE